MTRQILIAVGRAPEAEIAPLREGYDLHHVAHPSDVAGIPEEVRAAVRMMAFRSHHAFGAAEMDLLPSLELVANFGVGYDAIDVTAASARNIRVTNTPDVLSDDVADLAVAMLLAQRRELVEAANYVRAGRWAAEGAMPLARAVGGRKAGIVGLGRIGREIADRLAAFKLEIHYHSRTPKDTSDGWRYHADPVSLAAAVDYLFVALVGGPETEGYVSAEVIEALGPEGVIVNISRGSTIDERAMLAALEAGRLAGAALDVFRDEPAIDPRFLTLENVLPLPHIGSATIETRAEMAALQRRNIEAFVAGAPLITPVN